MCRQLCILSLVIMHPPLDAAHHQLLGHTLLRHTAACLVALCLAQQQPTCADVLTVSDGMGSAESNKAKAASFTSLAHLLGGALHLSRMFDGESCQHHLAGMQAILSYMMLPGRLTWDRPATHICFPAACASPGESSRDTRS